MAFQSGPIDQVLTGARVALDNAEQDAALQAGLAQFGYDAARLAEGRARLEAALALHTAQKAGYGDQAAATAAFEQALAAANAVYMRHLTLARVAFKHDPGASTALALDGRRKKTISGWLDQSRHFYDNLLASEARKAAMAALGQAEAALLEGRALLDAVAAANTAKERGKGEAQKATHHRNTAFDALDEWLRDFRTVARVAFAHDPQQLEKLVIRA